MLKEFIEKIIDLSKPELLEVDNLKYASRQLHLVKRPPYEFYHVGTLQGLVDLTGELGMTFPDHGIFIVVDSHKDVAVHLEGFDDWNRQQPIIKAEAPEVCRFEFGRFQDPDTFLIGLLSMFKEDENLKDLQKMVSSLTAERVSTSEDDGISQKVTIRSGVATLATATIKPLVLLRPYRTFTEIEQPSSQFLLRLKRDGDTMPKCGLFEADGGAWKVQAMALIKDWLSLKLPKIPVIL